ncbi:Rax1p NDAI_0E00630 [Naumovozyma dairenensis CBS 421]|uniref:RGS domain-containing protein n=1 Tax=Naumovozyma dairenensis (strain ATCC 10597 / BCRC 20456 / CBS 421 / NBRC 0211 / NRRL Y-12639) TaxID=1071378 RepID=G0WAV9_NAUDC|nr:hypothetical protein NDAI_0E00630 [Naumovozyma dairenensis CBS 421]CCD24879.1 hypothetical protein NDAI_0E00630 [Naumovozyma dairenensis CBS 421]
MELDYKKIQTERLPTLYEVLIQKTKFPVDLWSFYTFLSQFPYAINYLDFWIDLMAHLRLCKDYISGIRESITYNQNEARNSRIRHHLQYTSEESIQHETQSIQHHDDPEGGDEDDDDDDNISVTTSVLLNALLDEGHLDFENPERVSQFLQGNTEYSPKLSQLLEDWKRHSIANNDSNRKGSLNRNNSNVRSRETNGAALPDVVDDILRKQSQQEERAKITTKQLLNNALKICSIYLQSPERSERYLTNLPDDIRLKALNLVQNERRHDPQVFEELKSIAFQFLEMDCFPKFLSTVALHNIHDEISDWRFHSNARSHNLTRVDKSLIKNHDHISKSPFSTYTLLSRTIFGLLWLGIGFWIGYTLIFLKYDRGIRVVTIVPFAIGNYFIICGMYRVDIIYSWFGVTQRLLYKHNEKNRDADREVQMDEKNGKNHHVSGILALLGGRSRLIRIEHPFIKNILMKRGLWCLFLVLLSTGIFTVIFSCVPGYRI